MVTAAGAGFRFLSMLALAGSSLACSHLLDVPAVPADAAGVVWHPGAGARPESVVHALSRPADEVLKNPSSWPVESWRSPLAALAPEPDAVPLPEGRRALGRKSDEIPSGEACLAQLILLGVGFRGAAALPHMETPIVAEPLIGGIRYHGLGRVQLLCDCRLVVALARVGPGLRELGVTDIYYSGAYNNRMSRVGRLSLHAYGLAIDIHEVTVDGIRYVLSKDYERGLSAPCSSGHPLNQMGCKLRETGLFRELLTPDSDSDHHNHFHISITPIGQDPVARKKPEQKPKQGPAAPVASSPSGSRTSKVRQRPRRPEPSAAPVPAAAKVATPPVAPQSKPAQVTAPKAPKTAKSKRRKSARAADQAGARRVK